MCSNSCNECRVGSVLFICNTVDLFCGISLTIYSLYLGLNHFAPQWLYLPILALGIFLLFSTLMSWCGLSTQSCSSCLSYSSYLFILLAFTELLLALIMLTQRTAIDQFLQHHQHELKLSDDQLQQLEKNFKILTNGLFVLFGLEMMRICCSRGLYHARHYRKYHYHQMKTLHHLNNELLTIKTEKDISNKYAVLKEKFDESFCHFLRHLVQFHLLIVLNHTVFYHHFSQDHRLHISYEDRETQLHPRISIAVLLLNYEELNKRQQGLEHHLQLTIKFQSFDLSM
ncbi:hypothetical protein Plhal703r1_c06g0034321 [Plasmopara halstedii]